MRRALSGFDARRLRLVLGGFFLALALPTAVLVSKAYGQLKWEAFHHYQTLAEELAGRIDDRLIRMIDTEEARSFADYGFLVVAGDPAANFLQRSPLSELPVQSAIPGLMGYFQVGADGKLSSPLLPDAQGRPAAYGIPAAEFGRREGLASEVFRILSRNRLVAETKRATRAQGVTKDTPAGPGKTWVGRPDRDRAEAPALYPAPAPLLEKEEREPELVEAQMGFDRLAMTAEEAPRRSSKSKASALGRVEDLDLEQRYQRDDGEETRALDAPGRRQAPRERALRKERGALPEMKRESRVFPSPRSPETPRDEGSSPAHGDRPEIKVRIFESELDPFALNLLDSGHFVLYRKVWRDGQRLIQGALIEQGPFLRGLIEEAFRNTALSRMSELAVAYRGALLSAFSARSGRGYLSSARELTGTLLYSTRLSAPAGDLELIFGVDRLPGGPGAAVVGWLAVILALALCGGFYLMYRLGLRQIALSRQQQDFVSAVSHELKTPLTSIRMYGEMLREGWAPEEKKPRYYDFICTESERLSRLINNVLQLARLTRNELKVDLRSHRIAGLLEDIRPKLAAQVERAGFAFSVGCDEARDAVVRVDEDFLTQVLINLVDNAVKFSKDARRREIFIGCVPESGGGICLSVRDFGPGIPPDQMKKIFHLFYRSGNELTRETVGTGIGLALVRQLVLAMKGRVDAVNRRPGAEFRVFLPGPGCGHPG